jgi:hypothetical protein
VKATTSANTMSIVVNTKRSSKKTNDIW